MKTIKQVAIEPVLIDGDLPEAKDMDFGKMYISKERGGMTHLCLCGCGQEGYLPIQTEWWQIEIHDNKMTVKPSILFNNGCKSHYIITKNKANFV